jgi:hypothetical protein
VFLAADACGNLTTAVQQVKHFDDDELQEPIETPH